MSKEPAAIVGSATAIVSAILVFLKAFGINITDDQQEAVRGLVAVAAPLVAALIIRSFVVSPESASEAVVAAKQLEPGSHHVPEIKVAGYKDLVSDKLGRDPSNIQWWPNVAKP